MRIVLQRVSGAKVEVAGEIAGEIGPGLLVYLSVSKGDGEDQAKFIADKIANLRVFEDDAGKMNLSVIDTGGQVLLISNFTLDGNCSKGRRPSFDNAAEPEKANELYQKVCRHVEQKGIDVERGIFQAHMHVSSVNDGPVTFIVEK